MGETTKKPGRKGCTVAVKTLRMRLRDRHAPTLAGLAREVNFVWNYCNELNMRVLARERRFLSAFDFHEFTKGASKEGLGLHSQTIQAISEQYVENRITACASRLAWRASFGARRSLGWIPVKGPAIATGSGQIRYQGHWFSLWDSYGIGKYKIRSGSFCEDARGRWYFNAVVEVPATSAVQVNLLDVGIDLGLKDLATLSDGHKIEAPRLYRKYEEQLATAQRAGKRARVRAIHAKIKNSRADHLHKESSRIVSSFGAVYVGNLNLHGIARTSMAKSVYDASLGRFKDQLRYKCARAGVVFAVIDEAFSTQTCSECGALGGPKGIAGLGIREWCCSVCKARLDRDVNAARNILAAGRRRLVEGISVL